MADVDVADSLDAADADAPLTGSATETSAAPAADAFGADLAAQLQGKLVRPGQPGFAAASQLYNPRFDAIQPLAVAQVASAADVQACVKWATARQVPLRIRGGGHSYAGFSTAANALVVDMRQLATVQLATDGQSVFVGAGATLIDVQAALWPLELALSTGSCPTVGVAGLALGGGYGLIARAFGLTCDALLQAQVVLADGSLATANAVEHSDLFWALRGGGGQFGAVTSLQFAVQKGPPACTFRLEWPWQHAAAVVAAWQQWAPAAPDSLTATCHLFAKGKGAQPTVSVGGAFLGSKKELAAAWQPLQDLLAKAGVAPFPTPEVSEGPFGQQAAQWVDCDGILAHCHLVGRDPQGQMQRQAYRARSHYFAKPMPAEACAALVKAVEARKDLADFGGALLDPYGGAIAKVASSATAFAHRDMLFSCQYLANCPPTSGADPHDVWLDATYSQLAPHAAAQTYQNYADAQLADAPQRYYAGNLAKLQAVKKIYDPKGLFSVPQGV